MKTRSPAAIGFILKMFPRLSETFILNEILELERQGVPIRICSSRRPVDVVRHDDPQRVRADVTYVPQSMWERPWELFRAHVLTCQRHASGYWHAVKHTLRHWHSKSLFDRWRDLSQACYIIAHSDGLEKFHAHFVN